MSFFLVLLGLYALLSLPVRRRGATRGSEAPRVTNPAAARESEAPRDARPREPTRRAWIPERRRRAALAAGWFFCGAGVLHFVKPEMYTPMIPPALPQPELWVGLSGIAECAGGLGLLAHKTRRWAAAGLVALLLCVWPANIHVALSGGQVAGLPSASWYYWLRVPFQLVYVGWVLYAGGLWSPRSRRPLRARDAAPDA